MKFKANLLLTFLAILVLGLLLSLGVWQLDRADEKQALLDMQADRINLRPVDLSQVDLQDNDLRYLSVRALGVADTAHQILIDNQVKDGRVGYFVMTPLKLKSGRAVLLNRGWVAAGNDRRVLPKVALSIVEMLAVGKLDKFPSVGIKLKGADTLSEGWPAVVQLIDVGKVSKRLGYRVENYQMLLEGTQPYGFDRDWVPLKMGPEKHHGYAFQWFALALAWVTLYFVLTLKRRHE
ncbi:MAG: cytochrome oxidase biosynthesis protein [Cycloclasticus sp. symbiont of Poecilosclerida sp. M]|nr:MAG: cytochrome oxidase biosynthesis protein [Cycloclasticus sp. symbiont of Poecilosclerida sp. M]